MPDPETDETPDNEGSASDETSGNSEYQDSSAGADSASDDDSASDENSDGDDDDSVSDENSDGSDDDSASDENSDGSDDDSDNDDDSDSTDASSNGDGDSDNTDTDSADALQTAGADADANAGDGNVGDVSSSCDESPKANLTVKLVHQCDNSPINGGTVAISGPQSATLTTGADGLANFQNIAPDNYNIKGTAPNHKQNTATGNAPAGGTGNATVTLQATVTVAATKHEYTVVLDKNGNAPAAFPILQFNITNGPPNHLFDVQLSRNAAGDLTGGPGLANSWKEADGRDARKDRKVFSSWSNGQTTLSTDGSGNASFTMPLEWWRDQVRRPRSEFTDFTYSFRVVTFKAGPGALCAQSSVGSVVLHNNLKSFQITDRGYVAGGTKMHIKMEFKVREANTTEMFTFVQWKVGGREIWKPGPPPAMTPTMTRPTVTDYGVSHPSNYPTLQIDRVGTNPRYWDGTYNIAGDGLSASATDEPSSPAATGTIISTFTHIDFDTRVHLNFEVPASVTVSTPSPDVVKGTLADPQPITLDSGAWNTRVLREQKPDGTESIKHDNTYAGPPAPPPPGP